MIPLSPSWIISPKQRTVAKLIPNHDQQRFDIQVRSSVSPGEIRAAEHGTVNDGNVVYELEGKTYRTPIRTLRGDYRDKEGTIKNRVRHWDKRDFKPTPDDVFQERLYAIQWITKDTLNKKNKKTYFVSVTQEDLQREHKVERIVQDNLGRWQDEGLVPDMEIEPGGPPRYQGKSLIVNLGWRYWHHLFNARQLLLQATASKKWRQSSAPLLGMLNIAKMADFSAKLCRWKPSQGGGLGGPVGVFSNQALNAFYNYATRAWAGFSDSSFKLVNEPLPLEYSVRSETADELAQECDLWITDPPYANAVMYHEITDFFIGWLRKNPPPPFDEWIWDSRRDLAIKGSGDDFRRSMVDAYTAMTKYMPGNGMQCVMFTHQDTYIWSDMVNIFWAAGLQVVGAWYIATETTSELKKGGFVQGTVILMLCKRPAGDRPGFKQRILPQVKGEVDSQIKQMLHLNTETEAKMGTPVFNDSDLQMAGYAAALKMLTGFTTIGGEDVTTFALRPRRKGETTVVDEIVQQSAETANSLLVPDGLDSETWHTLAGIQRFYLRMLDMETTGASKLDNYQNFAKAFRVQEYAAVMASIKPNAARLKSITELKPRDLTDRTELGPTPLGALIVAIQEFLAEKEPEVVLANLRDAVVDYLHLRPVLIDMTDFIASKARAAEVRRAAEAIASRMRHQRLQ
jgi:putative DNA methylase